MFAEVTPGQDVVDRLEIGDGNRRAFRLLTHR
jgi:hypothetical protein